MGDVHGTWRPHHNLCNVDVDGLAYRVYHGVRHVDGVAEHRFEVVCQCGQYVGRQYTVVLIQNLVNGDFDSTHGVNVFYQNGAAMDASAAASNGTEEWAEFQASMAELTEREWENMYSITRAKVKEGDVSSANPVSMVFAFTVNDPAGFMSAFDAFWNSSAVQDFPGAVYLGQTIASGRMPGTHFVTWVADSRGNLVEAMQAVRNSPDTDAYRIAVSGKRTLEATNMSVEVKRWVNGG